MGDGTEFFGVSNKGYLRAWRYFFTMNQKEFGKRNFSDKNTLAAFLRMQFEKGDTGRANTRLVGKLVETLDNRGFFKFKPKGEKFTENEKGDINRSVALATQDYVKHIREDRNREPTRTELKAFQNSERLAIIRNIKNTKKLGLVDLRLDKGKLGGERQKGVPYDIALKRAADFAEARNKQRPELPARKPYRNSRGEFVLITDKQFAQFSSQRRK